MLAPDKTIYLAIRETLATVLQVTNLPTSTTTTVTQTRGTPPGLTETDSSTTVRTSPTFVGNTPSTVLFFIALAVGVFIALLFIFFTIRYFVRSKYGLHVYPLLRRHLIAGAAITSDRFHDTMTNEELQEHLNYIRDHHFIQTLFLERRFTGRRRRRRRGRYSRMKKLSEAEVEILFPKKTYTDWLNGGQERDHEKRDGVLQEEGNTDSGNLNIINEEDSSDLHSQTTVSDRVASSSRDMDNDDSIELHELKNEATNSVSADAEDDLHFTSGSCAICLETIGDEDIVRGLICGHVFHAECLDPWLTKRRACCPMCKRDYFFKKEAAESTETQTSTTNNETNNNVNENSDIQNLNENTNNNNDNTNNVDTSIIDDDDDTSIDYDAIRSNPAFRALLQELVPISERVRHIMSDPSNDHLDLEVRARAVAKKTYGRYFKVLWWKLMGISKEDLFNWAALTIFQDWRRANNQTGNEAENEAENEAQTGSTAEGTADSNDGTNTNDSNSNNNGNNNDTHSDSLESPVENRDMEEVDLGERDSPELSAARRDVVDNRV